MTDLEITKLCAQAMGYELPGNEWAVNAPDFYHPLGDDAQAMALVKKLGLVCDPQHDGLHNPEYPGWEVSHISLPLDYLAISPSLNRAICECVANMQKAKG